MQIPLAILLLEFHSLWGNNILSNRVSIMLQLEEPYLKRILELFFFLNLHLLRTIHQQNSYSILEILKKYSFMNYYYYLQHFITKALYFNFLFAMLLDFKLRLELLLVGFLLNFIFIDLFDVELLEFIRDYFIFLHYSLKLIFPLQVQHNIYFLARKSNF